MRYCRPHPLERGTHHTTHNQGGVCHGLSTILTGVSGQRMALLTEAIEVSALLCRWRGGAYPRRGQGAPAIKSWRDAPGAQPRLLPQRMSHPSQRAAWQDTDHVLTRAGSTGQSGLRPQILRRPPAAGGAVVKDTHAPQARLDERVVAGEASVPSPSGRGGRVRGCGRLGTARRRPSPPAKPPLPRGEGKRSALEAYGAISKRYPADRTQPPLGHLRARVEAPEGMRRPSGVP